MSDDSSTKCALQIKKKLRKLREKLEIADEKLSDKQKQSMFSKISKQTK